MTNFQQDHYQLEETILFAVCAAGKNAMTTAKGLDRFLRRSHELTGTEGFRPFESIRRLFASGRDVPSLVKSCGLGCYNQRTRTFRALVDSGLDLQTCTAADLEEIPGIGMKTSRFFLLHTREDVRHAVIDTHILKFLHSKGVLETLRLALTPARYALLEREFLGIWRRDYPQMTLSELDLAVWNYYAGHTRKIA